MTAPTVYQPTASQYASAACHLERQTDWRVIRIDSVRYVVMASASSGRTYIVRADAAGCSCLFNQRTGRQCSHMLAVERGAMLEELAESAPLALINLRALYPGCAGGCGAITDGTAFCDDCSARRERAQRMAAARAKGLEAWTQEEAG